MVPDSPDTDQPHGVVLVTGPSGAGRSTAIHVLEDLGYEAIDNLPLSLLPRLFSGPRLDKPLALGIDVRNRDFSTQALLDVVDGGIFPDPGAVQVLYLDCRAEVLLRRFSETRRRHPLAPGGGPEEGIDRERDLLAPVRARSDLMIDTSEMSPHDLRAELERWFAPEGARRLSILVESFSYKRGLPRALDMAFDCRFLHNPHWVAELRAQDGRDPQVTAHLRGDPNLAPFLERLTALLDLVLPAHEAEGRSHLAIGTGCTGGQHRSVAVAEMLASHLADQGWPVSLRHRELERREPGGERS